MRKKIVPPNAPNVVERVRSILASVGLTLSQASQRAANVFGHSSPFFFPHTLYYQLRRESFSPSLHQVFALSAISGYRFSDWLRVFGFNLEDLATLQVSLPSKRTILLDSSWTDSQAWVWWPRARPHKTPVPAIAPLAELLELSTRKRIGSLQQESHCLYAKIGTEDALAFPDLLPGSIVRVNPEASSLLSQKSRQPSERMFLIEHSKGLFCCKVRVIGGRLLVPISTLSSYAQAELALADQVRVLGTLDLEIRPLSRPEPPAIPAGLARQWQPQPLLSAAQLGELLRYRRENHDRSLREASELSRRIAGLLGDERYLVSASSLCDYELGRAIPRDFHKAVTICLIYGVEFRRVLQTMGIPLERAGAKPMPDDFMLGGTEDTDDVQTADTEAADQSGFLSGLLREYGEIPFFLRNAIAPLSGLEASSFEQVFWVGGEKDPLYPYLENGLLVLVNHRKKRPSHPISKPVWQQPVYMILKRDGVYVAACCGVENGTLVLHPYTTEFHRSERFRYRHDAEIVGQIIAVARKLA